MAFKIETFGYSTVTEPTKLHDGTMTEGQPSKLLPGFTIQAVGDTYIGGDDIYIGGGLKVKAEATASISAYNSRGSYESYNLNQVYYIGGPFKLIVEKEADR